MDGPGAVAAAAETAEGFACETLVPPNADAATDAGAAPGADGMVNAFWHVGQVIWAPINAVSHAIFWPHSGQRNLKSLIRLL